MVAYPSQVSTWEGIAILFYGLLCTYLEYQVDHQKEEFRATDGNEHIWGQKPQYLVSKKYSKNFFWACYYLGSPRDMSFMKAIFYSRRLNIGERMVESSIGNF